MKRILSLIMALVLCFVFTACGKGKDKKSATVDIDYYAKLGQIPECSYALGEDPETVKNELSALAESEEGHEIVYNVTEGENNVLIEDGTFSYYYKKAKPEDGIGCIVDFGTAYGFEVGTIILEIKEAIGEIFVEEEMNDENSFFMFGIENGTVLRIENEGNTVVFVFQDNALCATAIFTGSDW